MGPCQGKCECIIQLLVPINLCASLIGMSTEQKACSGDHWLCPLTASDSLVKQGFANIHISQNSQQALLSKLCVFIHWLFLYYGKQGYYQPCEMRFDSAFASRMCVIAHSYYSVSHATECEKNLLLPHAIFSAP